MEEYEATSTGEVVQLSKGRRTAITAGVMTGMFLAALEATVVGTAMPTVIAALGGMKHYSWVFSAYLLTSTVTVPVWGKLSDLYGRRLFYQIGVAVFLAGSVMSGLSHSMFQLIVWRALQGTGAGALVPLGMTIIGDIYTLQQRAKMQGLFSGVWGLSSVVGPLVGGFLTDRFSWRSVFFINIPFGIASALIIGLALKEPRVRQKPRIDYLGAALLTASVTILMLALVGEGASVGLAGYEWVLYVVALALGIAFVAVERRAAEPIVPLQLFRNRVVAVGVTAGFLAGIAMFGAISFVPLLAQGARGATATEAGSLLMPLMLSWVSMSVIGGRLMLRTGYRPMVLAGLVILTGGFVMLSTCGRLTPSWILITSLLMIGCGLGLTMLTLLIAVQHSVARAQLGIATSLNQFARSIGGAVGVAVMGAMLTFGLTTNIMKLTGGTLTKERAAALAANPNALIDPAARATLPAEVIVNLEEALARSMQRVFLVGALLSAVALIAALFLPRGKPHEVSAREQSHGDDMIMAEMTTIDAENEPCCLEDEEEARRAGSA